MTEFWEIRIEMKTDHDKIIRRAFENNFKETKDIGRHILQIIDQYLSTTPQIHQKARAELIKEGKINP